MGFTPTTGQRTGVRHDPAPPRPPRPLRAAGRLQRRPCPRRRVRGARVVRSFRAERRRGRQRCRSGRGDRRRRGQRRERGRRRARRVRERGDSGTIRKLRTVRRGRSGRRPVRERVRQDGSRHDRPRLPRGRLRQGLRPDPLVRRQPGLPRALHRARPVLDRRAGQQLRVHQDRRAHEGGHLPERERRVRGVHEPVSACAGVRPRRASEARPPPSPPVAAAGRGWGRSLRSSLRRQAEDG